MGGKRLVFQIACGPLRPLWQRCLESVARYAARLGVEHRVQTEPMLRIVPGPPRVGARTPKLGYLAELEKFCAWPLLGEFDELAVIDADVYAKPDAASVFDFAPRDFAFCAVVEPDAPLTPRAMARIEMYGRGQYGRAGAKWFQMGVYIARPSLLAVLGGRSLQGALLDPKWTPLINGEGAYRYSSEQTLANRMITESGVSTAPLPWVFNAAYGMVEREALATSHLVHFLSSHAIEGESPEKLLRTGNGRVRI